MIRIILLTVRVLIEVIFNIIGILNIKPLFLSNNFVKKRIAFQAYSIHLAQFYQTIISELLKDEKIEIIFIILPHPHFSLKSTFGLKEYANITLHIPKENIKLYWETIWDKFDLIFYTDVYAKFPLRKTRKYLLKHGPGVRGRVIKKSFLRLHKTIFDFDLTLLNGDHDFELIMAYCTNDKISSRLISIGFPYLDGFKHLNITREAYFKRLSLDMDKKTVLLAPHWRTLRMVQNRKDDFLDQVISVLMELDANIVIKLHACSFNKIMAGGFDWQKKLKKLSYNLKIRIDYNIDDIPALKYSDVLITDISSRAFNFVSLDKPVILYSPMTKAYNDQLDVENIKLIQQGSFVAASPSNIKDVFNQLNDRTLMSSERFEVSRKCFTNYGKATKEVINLIKDELGC